MQGGLLGDLVPCRRAELELMSCDHCGQRAKHQCPLVSKGMPQSWYLAEQHPGADC